MVRRRQRLSWFQRYRKYIYIGGGAAILGVLAFVITVFTLEDKENIGIAEENPIIVNEYAYKEDESSIRMNPEAIKKTEEEPKKEIEIEKQVEVAPVNKVEDTKTIEVTAQPAKKELTFIVPLDGDIALDYAKDKLVYSDTLEEWTTHSGIDIKGEEASPIKVSADGKVKDKKVDPRYGNTIIVEHEDGYKTIYSNLSTLDLVQINQEVKQGEIISGVGAGYGFELDEGPHIHFEILQNGQAINPTDKIK